MNDSPPQAWIAGWLWAARKRGDTAATVADAIEWWNYQTYLEAQHQ